MMHFGKCIFEYHLISMANCILNGWVRCLICFGVSCVGIQQAWKLLAPLSEKIPKELRDALEELKVDRSPSKERGSERNDLHGDLEKAYDVYCRPRIPLTIGLFVPVTSHESCSEKDSACSDRSVLLDDFQLRKYDFTSRIGKIKNILPINDILTTVKVFDVDTLNLEEGVTKGKLHDDLELIPGTSFLTLSKAMDIGWKLYDQMPSSILDSWTVISIIESPIGTRKHAMETTWPQNSNDGVIEERKDAFHENATDKIDAAAPSSSSGFIFRFEDGKRAAVNLSDRVLFVSIDNATDSGIKAFSENVITWLLYRGMYSGLLPDQIIQEGFSKQIDFSQWISQAERSLAISCFEDAREMLSKLRSSVIQIYGGTISQISEESLLEFLGIAKNAVKLLHSARNELLELEHYNRTVALHQARSAWLQAYTAYHHPILAVGQQLPPEHLIALILPIALPLGLALMQGIANEIKMIKKKRKNFHLEDKTKED